jgi:uncharacterized RDD family membrane protein YckC
MTVQCNVCKNEFLDDQVIKMGEYSVCEGCKAILQQGLKEDISAMTPAMVYGGFWIRFLAKVIDMIISWAIIFIFRFFGDLAIGGSGGEFLIGALGIVFWFAYSVFFVGNYGATPGKMALGLKIVRSDGTEISYGRAFGRFWAERLSGLTLTIGYIIAGFDREKRALHDRICDTRVVKA